MVSSLIFLFTKLDKVQFMLNNQIVVIVKLIVQHFIILYCEDFYLYQVKMSGGSQFLA